MASVDHKQRIVSASLGGPAPKIFPIFVARTNAASGWGDSAWEKICFPGAMRADKELRNLGIPGMGKPGQGFPARDRVGPIHGSPKISWEEAPRRGKQIFSAEGFGEILQLYA